MKGNCNFKTEINCIIKSLIKLSIIVKINNNNDNNYNNNN